MARLWVVNETQILAGADHRQTTDSEVYDEDIQHLIVCCICFDVFDEPKTLSCLHRFCEKCIHGYILGSQEQSTGLFKVHGFKCPLCREFIKAPDSKKPPLMWASLLKTDFHLKNLIKIVRSRKFPDVSNSEAETASCEKVHTARQRTMYCADCSVVICPTCARKDHKRCTMIVLLQEAAADQRATAAICLSEISSILEKADKLEEIREKRQEELEQQKSSIRQAIKRRADEVRQLVQQEENKLLETLEQEVDVQQNKIALEGIIFNDKLARYKDKFNALSTWLKTNSDLELMDSSRLTKNDDIPEEVNLAEYERFINSLTGVNVTFHQAKMPLVSLGNVFVATRRKNECQLSFM